MDDARLSPEQFKALVRLKGWQYKELATRWGISTVWVSNVARDPDRAVHYDDAVIGLPDRRRLARDLARRRKLLSDACGEQESAGVDVLAPADNQADGNAIKAIGEYRYHGHLTVGIVVAASNDIGSMAELGTRGVVFQVVDTGIAEKYGVIFETGMWDWFLPLHVDNYLATIGLNDASSQDYQYQSEIQLQVDFDAGRFDFWPSNEAV
ncbi:hypothetical protein [Burkholderia multivorans]|uniref:hypothetical protein n=1 Tax=Burkholderia multivorans TaxID=87883 RepID=UPI00158F5860|nr:hypothetical protein [Burkholderia multivorans]MDR8877555.1 hypothetical protein [Burkholderia multivorans]MDR8882500.1 hypothetical protein [Burkholderia multivorans]MDR8889439.1 hypothetical protein [Burkholderia multivorans]MDR8908792.1 hypothetical protein [Burkholderia multivorans]MDR8913901.1 hypothetical protein [Burkholderia multivorans]